MCFSWNLTVEQEDRVLTDRCAGFLPNRRLVLVTTSLACNAGSVRKRSALGPRRSATHPDPDVRSLPVGVDATVSTAVSRRQQEDGRRASR